MIYCLQVVLIALVYEKEQKLRIMMKMHGLADVPYWMISYAYFLVISTIYMFCFVIFGSLVGNFTATQLSLSANWSCLIKISFFPLSLFAGLKFFLVNDYSIQFVFYFIYINLQVALAFLVAAFFSNVKTATGLISAIKVAVNIARMNQYFILTFSIKHDTTNSSYLTL